MLRANETNFQHSGYKDPHRQRTYWWTHHPLEYIPNSKLPAPDTFLYNDDINWYDPSRWVLDLSYETVLGESIQLEPLDLSLKTTLEDKRPEIHASELLKTLLSSEDISNISKELEIIPYYPGEKTERGHEVSQLNQKEQHNHRTSCSAPKYVANPPLMHRSPESDPQKRYSENVTNKKLSGDARNTGKKSLTLKLPPPPPEPTSRQSSSKTFADPKDIVEYVKFIKLYEEIYKNLISQQETPTNTTWSQNKPTCSYDKSNPSTSRGFASSNQAQENFIDPAMIRRPPVKRTQTGNSSDFTLPSAVPLRASEASVAAGTHHGYSTQSSTRAVTSPLHYTSAGLQSSSSNKTSPQFKLQAITPDAVALQSYPSLSSSATPSSAPKASRQYSRSNRRWHPYPQRVSATTPSRPHSVSKPSTIPVPSGSATTTRCPSVGQGTRPKLHHLSANRGDAESGSTSNTEGFERRYSSLHERYLKQQFASVIENPEAYEGRNMIPGLSRHITNSGESRSGKQT